MGVAIKDGSALLLRSPEKQCSLESHTHNIEGLSVSFLSVIKRSCPKRILNKAIKVWLWGFLLRGMRFGSILWTEPY